ncbi:MAG: Ger(x)C family spore germination protein [Hydrogenibacillus sp.]|nr:Ger(x)C family spore germination protein [Hydrogenibacillus sp.]
MRKRTLCSLFIGALLFGACLSGCAYKDIDKRSFVIAVGVDASGDKKKPLRVTLKIAIPTSDIKSGENRFLLLTADGELVAEAIHRLSSMHENALDFSHTKLIFIGRSLAEEKPLREIMDWFYRMETIQGIALVALADPNANKVLKVNPPSERIPSNSLFTALDGSGTPSPYIAQSFLFDVVRRLYEPGLDPYLPIVRAKSEIGYQIDRIALFDKQKMRLTLNPEDSEWLNFLRGETSNVDFTSGKDKLYFQVDPNRAKAVLRVAQGEGGLWARFDLRLYGSIDERQKTGTSLSRVTKEIEAVVKEKTERLLGRLQKAEVDPIGIGLRYLSAYPGETSYRKYRRAYPTMPVEVNVQVTVYETGNVIR